MDARLNLLTSTPSGRMTALRIKQGRRPFLALAIVALLASSIFRNTALAATNIIVDATKTGMTIPSTANGMNTVLWDAHMQDAVIPGMLKQAGTQILRFPGGSYADGYHWQTNTMTGGGYIAAGNNFDNFMQNVAKPAGAQPLISVNYGSNSAGTGGGDPNEAASWVNYANKTKGYGIKYWEVGNEVYGNGYYGSSWEQDMHSDHSPTAYANNFIAYSKAMKAADSSIKVGLVLTSPGDWPDGAGPQVWNPTVLSLACSYADFGIVHWYAQSPGSESDSGLLASTSVIANKVAQLRSLFNQYCGSHAAQMGIMVTETNSVSYNPGKQTTTPINGLFLLQDYMEWLKAGVLNVDWWDLHNGVATGNNNSSSLAGSTTYGDYGVLSSGTAPEPAANTAFPTFTALTLLKSVAPAGATFVQTSSPTPDIKAYALKQPSGQLGLVLVNTNSSASYAVSPSITGFGPVSSGKATTFSLGNPQPTTSALSVSNGSFTYTMSPYSAAVLLLTSGSGGTATSTPTVTSTPTTPTSTATPTATPASTPLMLADFEGSTNGFAGNSDVTSSGPSTWSATVAHGNSSLWVQYQIPNAWSEAQLFKAVNVDLSHYSTLSVSVYAKQPTAAGAGVKVRFLAQGSDGNWYSSPYQSVPLWTRTAVSWNLGSTPRAALKQLYVCWQFTTSATSTGNEIWFDGIQAS